MGSLLILAFWEGRPGAQGSADGPKMVLQEMEFRFGEVMEGDTVEHTFRVLNQGSQPLEILNVKPG
jgi:hypothetical protein